MHKQQLGCCEGGMCSLSNGLLSGISRLSLPAAPSNVGWLLQIFHIHVNALSQKSLMWLFRGEMVCNLSNPLMCRSFGSNWPGNASCDCKRNSGKNSRSQDPSISFLCSENCISPHGLITPCAFGLPDERSIPTKGKFD